MTIWLEPATVRTNICETGITMDDESQYTIEDRGVSNGRATIAVQFPDGVTLNTHDCSDWDSLLSSLRGGNPEIELTTENNTLVVLVTADESVYRTE